VSDRPGRDQIVAALARKLTASRIVLTGSASCEQLAAYHPVKASLEAGGEQWTEFAQAPGEQTAVTVWFGAGAAGMSATATLGQLADAVADALGTMTEPPAAKHPIGFTPPAPSG
jgi:hypothetical protein